MWCLVCGDEFDPTEVTNDEEPLCSDECQDRYAEREQNDADYRY